MGMGKSRVMHMVECAHVSMARTCKLELAGWGQQAGVTAAPRTNTSDGPWGSPVNQGQCAIVCVRSDSTAGEISVHLVLQVLSSRRE